MRGGEHHLVEREIGEGVRLIAPLQETRQAEVTLPPHLLGAEGGPRDHIGHEVECRGEGPDGCLEAHDDAVPVGEGREAGAEEGHFALQREGVTRAGPFVEHAGHE